MHVGTGIPELTIDQQQQTNQKSEGTKVWSLTKVSLVSRKLGAALKNARMDLDLDENRRLRKPSAIPKYHRKATDIISEEEK